MVPFWGRAPPILVYLRGDWDVHWEYDLAFDPWPFCIAAEGCACVVIEYKGARVLRYNASLVTQAEEERKLNSCPDSDRSQRLRS